MGMIYVYVMMSRASCGKTQMAGGDIWGLESSGASSLTYVVPGLDDSIWLQLGKLLFHMGPLMFLDSLTAQAAQNS